jgi:hypothetical protein
LEDNGDAVLLAQAQTVQQPATTLLWSFTLTELKLQVNGPTNPVPSAGGSLASDGSNPIFVQTGPSGGSLTNATLTRTGSGIPYYALTGGYDVKVTVDTGVTTLVAIPPLITPTIEVIPIPRKDDKPPVIVKINDTTLPPALASDGKLTFNFEAPSDKGISNIGFDVEGMALAAVNRDNGLAPVRWHIRNGIDVGDYDNGENDITDSGAGILFAFGGAIPAASDVFIGFTPPVIP